MPVRASAKLPGPQSIHPGPEQVPPIHPAATPRIAARVRKSIAGESLHCAILHLAICVLLLLPAIAPSEGPLSDELLQQEWLAIQASKDRRIRGDWWQRLDPIQLRAFIEADAALNFSDGRGWTPLHSAARYNSDPDVVLALVEHGAVVNARDRAGDTPLHWAAAENPNAAIVSTLVSAGADVNARDRFGWLPIHSAADRNSNPEVIGALLEAGAQSRKRAYFFLFRPVFLLRHNSNMSEAHKETALALLKADQ